MAKSTALRIDPAIKRTDGVRTQRSIYFRPNLRSTRLAFIYVVAIPGALAYTFYQTEGLWDFRAKRRGDIISER